MVRFVETSEEFEELINSSDRVMVDFTASWCGPCQKIAPIYEELAAAVAKRTSTFEFVKVDVDNQDIKETKRKYGVKAMPTFVVFKNGEMVDSLTGASPPKLHDLIQKWI